MPCIFICIFTNIQNALKVIGILYFIQSKNISFKDIGVIGKKCVAGGQRPPQKAIYDKIKTPKGIGFLDS